MKPKEGSREPPPERAVRLIWRQVWYSALMQQSDDIDRRAYFKSLPSYGPDWDFAIEYGVDVMMLERNLAFSYEARLRNACNGIRFMAKCRAMNEKLYGQV
jgi:hypothetical protein